MSHAPCKNCPDRHEACWGSCEKYRAWREPYEKMMAARAKAMDTENLLHRGVTKRLRELNKWK